MGQLKVWLRGKYIKAIQVKSMVMLKVDKNGSGTVKSSSYNSKRMISGRSEMGTLGQYVLHRYRSVDCEHKTVVLERPKDLCFLSDILTPS